MVIWGEEESWFLIEVLGNWELKFRELPEQKIKEAYFL